MPTTISSSADQRDIPALPLTPVTYVYRVTRQAAYVIRTPKRELGSR